MVRFHFSPVDSEYNQAFGRHQFQDRFSWCNKGLHSVNVAENKDWSAWAGTKAERAIKQNQ